MGKEIIVEGWVVHPSTLVLQPVTNIEKRREEGGEEKTYAMYIYMEDGMARTSEAVHMSDVHKTIESAAQYLVNLISLMSEI